YRSAFGVQSEHFSSSIVHHFVSQQKEKKSSREIAHCGRVFKKSPLWVKNCGLWLWYDSHSDPHNTHQQYRDLNTVGAVTRYYQDMGVWHCAQVHLIQITKAEEIGASKHRLTAVKHFQDFKIKFLLCHEVLPCQHKPCFTTKRPKTFI
ncbi:unnamed protein product, partial [Gulo gulo]